MSIASKPTDAWAAGGAIPFRLRPDLLATEASDPKTGKRKSFLKVLTTGEVFQLGEEEHFICRQLDGRRGYEDVDAAFHARYGFALKLPSFRNLLHDMYRVGLLQRVDPNEPVAGRRAETIAEDPVADEPAEPSPAATLEDEVFTPVIPPEGDESRRRPYHWPWFDPRPVLRVTAAVLRPFRLLAWGLLPLVAIGMLTAFHHQSEMARDLAQLRLDLPFFGRLLVSIVFIEMFSKLIQGTVAYAYGAQIKECGLRLVLGILPHFYMLKTPIWGLPRRAQAWSFAAGPLARLFLFAAGTTIWAAYRGNDSLVATYALLIGQMGLGSFLFTSNPLWPTDGYNVLAVLTGRTHLRQGSLRLIRLMLTRKRVPLMLDPHEKWVLLAFGLGAIIYTGIIITIALLYTGVALEEAYQGVGVLLFLCLLGMFVVWVCTVVLANRAGRRREARRAAAQQRAAGEVHGSGTVVALNRYGARTADIDPRFDLPEFETKPKARWFRRVALAVAIGVLVVVAFLPYPYEAGGDFEVLPTKRVEVRARVEGEVLEVVGHEGAWVDAGDTLALLSDWDQRKDVLSIKAELDQATANLQLLEHGPKQETVAVAQGEVESAKVAVRYAQLEADRANTLLKTATISQAAADDANSELQASEAALSLAQANLDLVSSGALPEQIAAARAEVERLQNELGFRQAELERTRLTAPAAGQIVTANLQLLLGTHLPLGGLFAELEDNRTARVEVAVPETDIGVVAVGDTVRLRAWGLSGTMVGSVVGIAPIAEERDYGSVVRVTTDVPNPDQSLKSNMTGYAKITGKEMPVWEAFSRMFVRFFRIEVWSWLP